MKPKTFLFHHHQRKARVFEDALLRHGWKEDRTLVSTSTFFCDLDIMKRVQLFDSLHHYGVKLFCYPHAARPQVVYAWKDYQPHPHTAAQFVFAPGHVDVMKAIGYPHPIHVIGWSYCPMVDFKPVDVVRNVLFGPIHPNNNGWLSDVDKETNRKALERLKVAARFMNFRVTVRFLQTLESNGLKPNDEDPNVYYAQGRPDNNHEMIDAHDLVVGTQTFAYIAIARGKPTLMIDEHIPPRVGNSPEVFAYVRDWEKFKHFMMYPYDLNTTDDVPALIRDVCKSDEGIQHWKAQMIGKPFNAKRFSEIVETYIQ